MRTPVTLGAYAAVLVVAFGAAFGVGRLAGPLGAPERDGKAAMGDMGAMTGGHAGAAGPAKGLAITSGGYTLVPGTTELAAHRDGTYRFRITGPGGATVTRFTTEHGKKLHFIAVRRDFAGYRHLHPVMAADGTWSVRFGAADPGAYRVFTDFAPTGGPAGGVTLGADLTVPGTYHPGVPPAPSRTATVDGYTVTLHGDLRAGKESPLTLAVAKNGRPVTDLQPYLGAYGHLVALRAGDLGYLHVHPQGAPGDGKTRPGPDVTFHAEVPTSGTYRLFLDFRHDGGVHTAAFTARVA